MAKQRTRKTAIKRVQKSNPKGNRKEKMLVNASARHHLMTKRSRVTKRRKPAREAVSHSVSKQMERIIVNIK